MDSLYHFEHSDDRILKGYVKPCGDLGDGADLMLSIDSAYYPHVLPYMAE